VWKYLPPYPFAPSKLIIRINFFRVSFQHAPSDSLQGSIEYKDKNEGTSFPILRIGGLALEVGGWSITSNHHCQRNCTYHVPAAHIYRFGLITCIMRHVSTLITVDADASRCRCNHICGARPCSVYSSFIRSTLSTVPPGINPGEYIESS
jgi:hypothetical protein